MLVAPGVLFSAIGRVTLPSAPVTPIAAAPPIWMSTGLPATPTAPAFRLRGDVHALAERPARRDRRDELHRGRHGGGRRRRRAEVVLAAVVVEAHEPGAVRGLHDVLDRGRGTGQASGPDARVVEPGARRRQRSRALLEVEWRPGAEASRVDDPDLVDRCRWIAHDLRPEHDVAAVRSGVTSTIVGASARAASACAPPRSVGASA